MIIAKYDILPSINCFFSDIYATYSIWDINSIFNYESVGRSKHLLYYQTEGQRDYYFNNKLLLSARKHDIIFIPDGTRYYTNISADISAAPKKSSGIGISFNMFSENHTSIKIEEPLQIVYSDKTGLLYTHFEKILFSILHPHSCSLMLNGELFTLLDKIFSKKTSYANVQKNHFDIYNAIRQIEEYPEQNISNKQLADLCFMSESTFIRKFKSYSGGIAPTQYRNNIRIMLAEELLSSTKTLNEIAELLGFYDASHLCRIYKQRKKHTLKNPDVSWCIYPNETLPN